MFHRISSCSVIPKIADAAHPADFQAIVVAGSAVGLKSRQQAQRALDKQRNILAADQRRPAAYHHFAQLTH
ncbi:hypothetical protein FK513_31100, partial [Klebsiella pneumoniae]|nr:hypothetical protein [Klebsiella pneumoniae]